MFPTNACKFLPVRTLLVPVLVPVAEVENDGLDSHFSSVLYPSGDVIIQCAGQWVPVHNAGCYRNVAAKNVATAKNGSPPMPGIIITNGSAPKPAVAKPARRRAKNSGIPNRQIETTGADRMKWNESGCGARRTRSTGSEPDAGNRLRYKIS